MTWPAPDPRTVLAHVERGTYTTTWDARCTCGELERTSHPTQWDARNAAHALALRCPTAKRRLTQWRRQQRGLVA